MPSYLGKYKSSATNKDTKIVRAIYSVLEQSYQDFELVIVADGCHQTVDIVKQIDTDKISLYFINKQRMWSGLVRNTGIHKSEGEWIVYLDIDDMFGPDHLKIIAEQLGGKDWYWFNDRSWNNRQEQFNEHHCQLIRGKCGTSNLCHRPDLVGWDERNNYYQDWQFVSNLMIVSKDYEKIETPQYLICHVPGLLDYDGNSKEMSV